MQWIEAPEYLDRIVKLAERIACASDDATVQCLLHEVTHALAIENAIFVSFEREKLEVASCRFMLACEPATCRDYLAEGLLPHDPWLAYAVQHTEPAVATTLVVTDPQRQRFIDFISQRGFASALLVPVHSGEGSPRSSLLTLGSSEPGIFESVPLVRLKVAARMLACELHDWWLRRHRRDLLSHVRLNEADADLLQRYLRCNSTKRIANDLNVSPTSIHSRFQRINARLGVNSRRTAAKLAAECGFILP